MNKDAKDTYTKQLEDKIVTLEARIQELERLLGMNSQNSSKPPSSDGPEVSKPHKTNKGRKKRGAQKGHNRITSYNVCYTKLLRERSLS